MNRLGLKISCVVVSVVIWMQVASTAEVTKTARLPVSVEGLRDGLTVAGSEIPATIGVNLTGSKLRLMAHQYFNHYVGEVKISLADQEPGPAFYYDPLAEDVYTDLTVPPVLQAASFQVRVDTLITRVVPVTLSVRGELDPALGFAAPPEMAPDSVAVTGPARFFPDRFGVRTEPLDLARVTGSADLALGLVAPHEHLRVVAPEVTVSLRVGPMEERTLANVPVVALVDAGRPAVGISPPMADVMVRGVADSVSRLTADRLSVIIPVNDLAVGVHQRAGQVDHPAWLTLVGMDPAVFQVIVGNPPLLPDTALAPTPGGGRDD